MAVEDMGYGRWRTEHLRITDFGRFSDPPSKSHVYRVMNRTSDLGFVSWRTPWRRYVFEPAAGTAYSPDCLRDLAEFCEARTRERKEKTLRVGAER